MKMGLAVLMVDHHFSVLGSSAGGGGGGLHWGSKGDIDLLMADPICLLRPGLNYLVLK